MEVPDGNYTDTKFTLPFKTAESETGKLLGEFLQRTKEAGPGSPTFLAASLGLPRQLILPAQMAHKLFYPHLYEGLSTREDEE